MGVVIVIPINKGDRHFNLEFSSDFTRGSLIHGWLSFRLSVLCVARYVMFFQGAPSLYATVPVLKTHRSKYYSQKLEAKVLPGYKTLILQIMTDHHHLWHNQESAIATHGTTFSSNQNPIAGKQTPIQNGFSFLANKQPRRGSMRARDS